MIDTEERIEEGDKVKISEDHPSNLAGYKGKVKNIDSYSITVDINNRGLYWFSSEFLEPVENSEYTFSKGDKVRVSENYDPDQSTFSIRDVSGKEGRIKMVPNDPVYPYKVVLDGVTSFVDKRFLIPISNFDEEFSEGDRVRVVEDGNGIETTHDYGGLEGEIKKDKGNSSYTVYLPELNSNVSFMSYEIEKIEDQKSENVKGQKDFILQVPDDSASFAQFLRDMAFDFGFEKRGMISGNPVFVCGRKVVFDFEKMVVYNNPEWPGLNLPKLEDITYEDYRKALEGDFQNSSENEFVDEKIGVHSEIEHQLRAYLDIAREYDYEVWNNVNLDNNQKNSVIFYPRGEVIANRHVPSNVPEISWYEDIGVKELREILNKERK